LAMQYNAREPPLVHRGLRGSWRSGTGRRTRGTGWPAPRQGPASDRSSPVLAHRVNGPAKPVRPGRGTHKEILSNPPSGPGPVLSRVVYGGGGPTPRLTWELISAVMETATSYGVTVLRSEAKTPARPMNPACAHAFGRTVR